MLRPRFFSPAFALLLLSCSGAPPDSTTPTDARPAGATAPGGDASTPSSPVAGASSEPQASGHASSPSSEEIAALLDRWLAAQNEGDFESYQALYAERFLGVKRSGPRTVRFDRAGWLADRQRMFRKKVTVLAEDRKVSSWSAGAKLLFKQTWSSGSYKDVGPKQLVLSRQGGALRIAREEMLSSSLLHADPAAGVSTVRELALLVGPGRSWLALREAEQDESEGTPELVGRGPITVARPAAVGAEGAAWADTRLRLYGSAGPLCEAAAGPLAVVSMFEPHWAQSQQWDGVDDEGEQGAAWSDRRIAEDAWSVGGLSMLASPVETTPSCEGALWARDASLPAPAVLAEVLPVPRGTADHIRAAFSALRGHRALQAEYEAEEDPEPDRAKLWHEHSSGGVTVRLFGARGGTRYAAASVQAGDGCGRFYGEFWALWSWQDTAEGPSMTLLTDPAEPGGFFAPTACADVDGDGSPEFISNEAVVRSIDGSFQRTVEAAVPSYDCGC